MTEFQVCFGRGWFAVEKRVLTLAFCCRWSKWETRKTPSSTESWGDLRSDSWGTVSWGICGKTGWCLHLKGIPTARRQLSLRQEDRPPASDVQQCNQISQLGQFSVLHSLFSASCRKGRRRVKWEPRAHQNGANRKQTTHELSAKEGRTRLQRRAKRATRMSMCNKICTYKDKEWGDLEAEARQHHEESDRP